MKRLATMTALALFLAPLAAHAAVVVSDADVLADPQIFVQQSGTAPAGGDPNLITNASSFVVGVAGSATLQSPLLIVVANYNGGTSSISFTGCGGLCDPATVGTYGLTDNTALFDATSTGSAFAQFGLTAGGSESFGNLSAADVAAGFAAPTDFLLEVFKLPVELAAGHPITIGTTAVDGSFILAYGCEIGTGTPSGCTTHGDIGQTVATNTGLINDSPPSSVPEPASLAIFGAALAGLGLVRRRRRS